MDISQIFNGDCLNIIPEFVDNNSVDLIMTSPPYADQRKNQYGGIAPDKYVTWFLPRSQQFYNCLKPGGSFALNIKEKVVDGERSTYVLELIQALRSQGWRWVEEYCWHKKNSYPGKWPNRFRDSWERIFHFTKNKKFKMNQDSVQIPIGDWKKTRLHSISEKDRMRNKNTLGNRFGTRFSNFEERDFAYPSNVLHMPTQCSNTGHPATFPEALPSWFIKLFTDQGDLVLDPFAGSGTTLKAANKLNRYSIGIDLSSKYCELMKGGNQKCLNL